MNQNNHVGPINTGNPHEFTMLDLAKILIDLTKSKSKIVFKELPEDDPSQRKPDNKIAKDLLGWEPKVDLIDGLKRTVEYFKSII